MVKRVFMAATGLLIVLALGVPVLAQEHGDPGAKAVEFLLTVQNEDGGFSNGFAPESDIGTTADMVVAATLAGRNPQAFMVGDLMNPLTFLGVQVDQGNVAGAGQWAKVLTAVIAAGKDPRDFAGHDLVADLLTMQTAGGLFGTGAFDHCLAMIALENAAVELPGGTVEALLAAQNENGGWGFMAGELPDSNTTALCLQALALTDAREAIEAGLTYLASIQNEDGGWPYQSPSEWGTDSDSSSTALVIQALIATGNDLVEWNNPQNWLLTMQLKSGAFSFQVAVPGDNVLATVAAVPAIEGQALNAWALTAQEN